MLLISCPINNKLIEQVAANQEEINLELEESMLEYPFSASRVLQLGQEVGLVILVSELDVHEDVNTGFQLKYYVLLSAINPLVFCNLPA